MVISPRPRLIIISGPPAAGKSTSAKPLADALGFPLLRMDDIKERLADAIGPDALAIADALGTAAVRELIATSHALLRGGGDLVIEGYFQSDTWSDAFAELASHADTVLVHMRAADDVLKDRYAYRAIAEERHWIHGDIAKIGTLLPELPVHMAEPLHLQVPTLDVNTTSGPIPADFLAERVRRMLPAFTPDFPAAPVLVIVSGPPGAGKSTLAAPLAAALGLPMLAKDPIKERFADWIGAQALPLSPALGLAAHQHMVATAAEMLQHGQGLVIESFFHKGLSERDLLPLTGHARAILIHVRADDAVLLSRYAQRESDGLRHPIHGGASRFGQLRHYLAEGVADPIDLPIPHIVIDTTFGPIDVDEVAMIVREELLLS